MSALVLELLVKGSFVTSHLPTYKSERKVLHPESCPPTINAQEGGKKSRTRKFCQPFPGPPYIKYNAAHTHTDLRNSLREAETHRREQDQS